MEVLFKNTTKFSKDMYNEFLVFHSKTYDLSYFLYTIGVLLLLLYCMAIQIRSDNYLLLTICIFLFLGFLGWRLFHPVQIVKKEFSSDRIQKETEITYLFFEKYYIVCYNNASHTMHYSRLRRVFETDTFFYFYLDKTHAFLLDKSNFTLGEAKDFSSFIKRKVPLKYRRK